tara:strand:- start:25 stop:723 length:699 start_codon:yes stop_codon:yes gene_type:complete
MATDKVTAANRKIAAAASRDTARKIALGPVGAKMAEMLEIPSFAKGLKPSMLFDLAKDKGIITKEQQADFTKRVGKDRRALSEFNQIVIDAGEPRLAYRGQSPVQIEMIKAKGLTPATAANQPERINVIKQTNKIFNEVSAMDAPKEVKEETFLKQMKQAFGEFSNSPIVRLIANKGLMILKFFPQSKFLDALEFIPDSILQEGMGMMDSKPDMVAKGGIMSINDITGPIGV